MADGYGFGAEGDWKTSVMLRTLKVVADGLPGGTSFMEDYTYDLAPGNERILGAHMLEVCPSIASTRPSLEIHPLSIGNRDDPVRLKFTADARARPWCSGLADLGERFRLVANEIDVVEPTQPLPRAPGRVRGVEAEAEPADVHRVVAGRRRTAPHRAVVGDRHRGAGGLRPDGADRARRHRRRHHHPELRRELRWSQAYYRLAQGF